jgi:branched-chain amino acid transport system ATP-binding protein
VEQNIHRALEFVERAYVIENGRTVLEGSREQLLNDASFGAKLLGLD